MDQIYAKFQLFESQNQNTNMIYEEIVKGVTLSAQHVQINISHLEMFTLYKNIHGLKKIQDNSLAYVDIYLSYISDKFQNAPKTSIRLYDSKCLDCDLKLKSVKFKNCLILLILFNFRIIFRISVLQMEFVMNKEKLQYLTKITYVNLIL